MRRTGAVTLSVSWISSDSLSIWRLFLGYSLRLIGPEAEILVVEIHELGGAEPAEDGG
jgi:hypothetical protein